MDFLNQPRPACWFKYIEAHAKFQIHRPRVGPKNVYSENDSLVILLKLLVLNQSKNNQPNSYKTKGLLVKGSADLELVWVLVLTEHAFLTKFTYSLKNLLSYKTTVIASTLSWSWDRSRCASYLLLWQELIQNVVASSNKHVLSQFLLVRNPGAPKLGAGAQGLSQGSNETVTYNFGFAGLLGGK